MNQSNARWKTKIILTLMLASAGLIDLFVGQLLLDKAMGLAPIFLALAAVFILQDLFRWVRIALLGLIGAIVLYRLMEIIGNLDVILSRLFFMITQPAAIPLYSVLVLIGILSYVILKTNWIIQYSTKQTNHKPYTK